MTQPATSPAKAQRPGLGYAWYVVIVLTAIYMLSFVDRQILSLLVGPIKRDLAISDTRIGLLQGLSFALFYTVMGLPLGRAADKRNRRNLVSACILVWSLFTGLCSVAKSFWSLFLTRIGVGIGEAGLSPAAYSMLADYFPSERLGVAISVYYMGVFLGSGAALLVGGSIVDALVRSPLMTLPLLGTIASWRVTFLLVGFPGLVFAALVYTVREPLRRDLLKAADGRTAQLSLGQSIAEMRLRWTSLIGLSFVTVFQALANYALTAWSPTFFIRVHGWTAGQAGRALAWILVTAGCLGIYAGGVLSDRWLRHGVAEAPLKVSTVSALGTLVFLPAALLVGQPGWTLALLVPGVFFLALPMGIVVAALQRIFPNQVRGQVSALLLFLLNLGGLSLGPLLPGVFNDYLFHNGKMVGASLALTIGGAAVLMLLAAVATYRPYRGHYRAMQSVAGL
ncbi:MAG TPA: MFS transporter [Bryobacteraceae bacterium]|nr:MFS transporter [Bryobacteraceae bacterium]